MPEDTTTDPEIYSEKSFKLKMFLSLCKELAFDRGRASYIVSNYNKLQLSAMIYGFSEDAVKQDSFGQHYISGFDFLTSNGIASLDAISMLSLDGFGSDEYQVMQRHIMEGDMPISTAYNALLRNSGITRSFVDVISNRLPHEIGIQINNGAGARFR